MTRRTSADGNENGIVWEPLPEASGRAHQGTWKFQLEALMVRPGEWARLRVYPAVGTARNAKTQLKRGFYTLPPGRFEFAVRQIEEGHAVYARYLGPEEVSR